MNKIEIAVVSDIHNDFRIINELEESVNRGKYEVLFVCGDLTQFGTDYELEVMFNRLGKLKHENGKKVAVFLVAGNHDIGLSFKSFRRKMQIKNSNIRILNDSYYIYKGIVLYGTPYSKSVGSWAFGCEESEFIKHLPKKHCDILLTHNPPSDKTLSFYPTKDGYNDIGFKVFSNFLNDRCDIKYNFHGHCHECGGNFVAINQTLCYNVSSGIRYLTLIRS